MNMGHGQNNPRIKAILAARDYGRAGAADELRGLLPEEEEVSDPSLEGAVDGEGLPVEDVPGVEEAVEAETEPGLADITDIESLTPEQIAAIEDLLAQNSAV